MNVCFVNSGTLLMHYVKVKEFVKVKRDKNAECFVNAKGNKISETLQHWPVF